MIFVHVYLKIFIYICKTKLKDMTKREFTEVCAKHLESKLKGQLISPMLTAARRALNEDRCDEFIAGFILQDSDEGSRSGTRHMLGEDLYNELQKFKTEKE